VIVSLLRRLASPRADHRDTLLALIVHPFTENAILRAVICDFRKRRRRTTLLGGGMQRFVYSLSVAALAVWSALCFGDLAYEALWGEGFLIALLTAAELAWAVEAATVFVRHIGMFSESFVLWVALSAALGLLALTMKPKPSSEQVIGLRPIRGLESATADKARRPPAPSRPAAASDPAPGAARPVPQPVLASPQPTPQGRNVAGAGSEPSLGEGAVIIELRERREPVLGNLDDVAVDPGVHRTV
jgi:hypothetical protein